MAVHTIPLPRDVVVTCDFCGKEVFIVVQGEYRECRDLPRGWRVLPVGDRVRYFEACPECAEEAGRG